MRISKGYLAILLFFLVALHDYVFLNMYSAFGSYFNLNLWKEIIFLVFFSCYLIFGVCTRYVNKRWLVLVFLFFAMCFVLLVFGEFNEPAIRTLRSIFMPVFIAFIVSLCLVRLSINSAEKFISAVIFFGVLNAAYGAYQFFTITSMDEFWYVAPLQSQNFNIAEHNSLRNGYARISGFFTSSLEFAFFSLFIFIVWASRLYARKSKGFEEGVKSSLIWSIVCFLFLGFAIAFSTVRSAHISLIIAVFYFFVVVVSKRVSPALVFFVGLILALMFIAFTFSYIAYGFTSDLSALGRVKQWKSVFEILSANPLGMGLSYVGPTQANWYDSLALNILASTGWFAIVFFSALMYVYYKICVVCSRLCRRRFSLGIEFSLPVVIFFPVFLYASFFQAMYNSQVLYVFFIFVVASFVVVKNVE